MDKQEELSLRLFGDIFYDLRKLSLLYFVKNNLFLPPFSIIQHDCIVALIVKKHLKIFSSKIILNNEMFSEFLGSINSDNLDGSVINEEYLEKFPHFVNSPVLELAPHLNKLISNFKKNMPNICDEFLRVTECENNELMNSYENYAISGKVINPYIIFLRLFVVPQEFIPNDKFKEIMLFYKDEIYEFKGFYSGYLCFMIEKFNTLVVEKTGVKNILQR